MPQNASMAQSQNGSDKGTAVEKKLPDMNKFVSELEKLLKRYYPKIRRAEGEFDPGVVQFEYNTMKFMIHHALKTGEWQPAHECKGPQRHGVVCGIRLSEGKFLGAAMVPQVFDDKYYNTLLMAPYYEKDDCHLMANLSYPESDVDPNFLREYQRLVNSFHEYLK